MKRSILVVDDEEPIRFALTDYLSAEGWEVSAAQEMEEAEALLMHQRFEAAILDLRLTRYSGSEGLGLLQLIHARYPRTRVILLTAFGSPEVEERARQLGVGCVLQKPQPLPFIAELVDRLVEEQHAEA
jgi:DNA-binding NtrC family response regulator